METAITSMLIVCIFSQIFNMVIVGRFIDIIEGMHKREYRRPSKTSTKDN